MECTRYDHLARLPLHHSLEHRSQYGLSSRHIELMQRAAGAVATYGRLGIGEVDVVSRVETDEFPAVSIAMHSIQSSRTTVQHSLSSLVPYRQPQASYR